MRAAVVGLVVAVIAGCEHHQVTPSTAADYARPLATDSLPFLFERAKVRAYMASHRWCKYTPVACRHDEYGDETCDSLFGRGNFHEAGFLLRDAGLRDGLVALGERTQHADMELPEMQQRTVDALTVELEHRFGRPAWADRHRYGAAWETATSEIGLFVAQEGDYVVETHELKQLGPPGLRPATRAAVRGR